MKLYTAKRIEGIGFVSFCLVMAFFFLFWVGSLRGEDTGKYVQELSSKDPAVRMEAARKLGETKDSSAVSPLIDVLKRDKNWGVRAAAEDALVSIGEPAVKPLTALLNDQDWHVRRRAARTLGEIHNPVSDEALVVAMRQDGDCCVRKFSAKALGNTNDPRAVDVLMAALRERNMEVVTGAYRFFIRRGEPGSEAILIEALSKSWNRTMACDYFNCGNEKLKKAASDRAKKRAESGLTYYTADLTADWQGPKWGGNN